MRILLIASLLVIPVAAQFKAVDKDGRIEIRDGDQLVLGYQYQPVSEPKGGEAFAASAFLHPLTTPSGFVLTDVQPDDHLHHFGVWWPWKLVEVEGKKHVTWELQKKEGRHRALKSTIVRVEDNEVIFNAHNATEICNDGQTYRPVIKETTAMLFKRFGDDGYSLDLGIYHQPIKKEEVIISKYRYSGFCWRGSASWTADNSTMLASGGQDREKANHQPAKWCMVSGVTPKGKATMLMMSAAAMDEGQPELLRVWNASMHHGNPFVNFNPVVKESMVLNEENEAVSRRSYRLIMVDRELKAEEAERYWKQWTTGQEPGTKN